MTYPLTPGGKKVVPTRPAPSGGEDNSQTQAFAKGGAVKACSYAKGGAVLGRVRDFLKESDGKDQRVQGNVIYKNPDVAENDYGKSKAAKDLPKTPSSKSLKAVKPRG